MILKRLSTYIQMHERVEESAILKEFRLNERGLAPFVETLIRTGNVQKTVVSRGDKLSAHVFYSWKALKVIPMTTIL